MTHQKILPAHKVLTSLEKDNLEKTSRDSQVPGNSNYVNIEKQLWGDFDTGALLEIKLVEIKV